MVLFIHILFTVFVCFVEINLVFIARERFHLFREIKMYKVVLKIDYWQKSKLLAKKPS